MSASPASAFIVLIYHHSFTEGEISLLRDTEGCTAFSRGQRSRGPFVSASRSHLGLQHRGCLACFLLQLASRTGGAESTALGAQIVPNWKGQVWKVCLVPYETDLACLAL